MTEVSLLLWDVGGVVLSNAWDHDARRAAVARFGLDGEEFERRHDLVAEDFDKGRVSLSDYLARCVFDRPRDFSVDEFQQFMFGQSRPQTPALALARDLHRRGQYLMVAFNNESLELNRYRIDTFRLQETFDVFLSSCYTGLRKPDAEAYRFALNVTQRDPDETLFLDDRPENVEAARLLGIRTILVQDPARLPEELANAGVVAG